MKTRSMMINVVQEDFFSHTNLCRAARELTSVGFKLYCFYALRKDVHKFPFVVGTYLNDMGVSGGSVATALDDLVEHGYLTQKEYWWDFSCPSGATI